MTMTDTPATPVPAKPKRKLSKRRAAAAKHLTLVKSSDYDGMTKVKCADGCRPDRCVVSHIGYCAHPAKGELQASQMHDAKAIARLAEAKEFIRVK